MIGLLPAAGQATRMNGLPKYLLPVPGETLLYFHSSQMHGVGCDPIWVGTVQDGLPVSPLRVPVHTLFYNARQHNTMSETVRSVLEWLPDEDIADNWLFGMPDTYFEDTQAYRKLANALEAGAQVAVGLFYTRPEQRSSLGMCQLVDDQITDIVDKPQKPHHAAWAWGMLGWQPVFWEYIKPEEPHIGYAIPRAIAAGLDVRAVMMKGRYWDCGTPEEYFACIRAITDEA